MRCLITGATGFVGRHLAAALMADGHEVIGLARRATTAPFDVRVADLLDTAATEAALRSAQPEWLFHLAGYADAGKSFTDPVGAWSGNLTASLRLYEAIHKSGLRPRIVHVSSGLVYGDARPDAPPPTEESALRPASPYAASKAAADLLAYQQTRNPGLHIVRVRPFNQIGPGQPPDYFAASFARQIAAAERGKGAPVVVAKDLSPYRDLTDVRDMARAYIRLMEVGRSGEAYTAGSGRVHQIREVLERMIQQASVPITVDEQGDPSRAGDTALAAADTRKLRTATGWQPAYSLDQTLGDILEDWRRRIG